MAFFYGDDGQLKIGTQGSPLGSLLGSLLGSPQTSANATDVASLLYDQTGPVYLYDLDNIKLRFGLLTRALEGGSKSFRHTVHYAMKANSHPAILKALAKLGAGVDTVSGGEVRIAIAAGIPADRVIFSGVAKTEGEIEYALAHEIKQINVESPQELERIAKVARSLGRRANVAFRMNPDVNPKTHPYITTGFRENKFGMDESFLPELIAILKRESDWLKLRGLTQHIGSQLFDLKVMKEAIEKTIKVHRYLETQGFALDRLDVGGGIGIHYDKADDAEELDMVKAYGVMVREAIAGLNVELLTEPGRILVARAGLLVGEVQYIKKAPAKTFAVLDTGMNHLLRPALYSAKHRILPLRTDHKAAEQNYDIVGPICESSDVIAKEVRLKELKQGDRIGIADAGAYGFVMASHYNAHALPAELIISEGRVI